MAALIGGTTRRQLAPTDLRFVDDSRPVKPVGTPEAIIFAAVAGREGAADILEALGLIPTQHREQVA